jgi:ParB-like nuclease domain.
MKVLGIKDVEVSKIEVIQGLLPRVETHTVEDKVEEYKEAMALGSEFPPITVWQKGNEYWLIDGMHRLMATKRLGRETIKAEIVELKDMLEAKVLAITKNKHGLPLTKEEKRLLCQSLYMDGVEISELIKIFNVSERTIYNWTSGLKRREKPEEMKEKAKELKEQGHSLREIARQLDVHPETVRDWTLESVGNLQKLQETDTPPPDSTPKPAGDWKTKPMGTWTDEDLEQAAKEIEELITDELLEEVYGKREEQKKSNAGRPPKEPPSATEEELYEELKDKLLTHIYNIVLKIGWEKTLQLLDEARERAIEMSKSSKRGW